jgi:hypothetical protein
MTTLHCRASFFVAFRILAWKHVYFVRRISELGPEYYCPTCELPLRHKTLYPNCPKCPLTEKKIWLKRTVLVQLKRQEKSKGWPFPNWPYERVKSIFDHVNRLLRENGNNISKAWDRRTAALARVILQERDTVALWDEYEKRDRKTSNGK